MKRFSGFLVYAVLIVVSILVAGSVLADNLDKIRIQQAIGGQLASGSVSSDEITDATIATADIADDAVDADKLAADSVVKGSLAAVDFGDWSAAADGTCTIDAGVITASKIDPSMVMPAVDVSAVTNGNATTIFASGTVPNARLDSDLQAVAAQTGSTGTNAVVSAVTIQAGEPVFVFTFTPQTVALTDTNGVTATVWTNATLAVASITPDIMTNIVVTSGSYVFQSGIATTVP